MWYALTFPYFGNKYFMSQDWGLHWPTFFKTFFFFYYYFNSVSRPFQDYCSSYETGHSVGGR